MFDLISATKKLFIPTQRKLKFMLYGIVFLFIWNFIYIVLRHLFFRESQILREFYNFDSILEIFILFLSTEMVVKFSSVKDLQRIHSIANSQFAVVYILWRLLFFYALICIIDAILEKRGFFGNKIKTNDQ